MSSSMHHWTNASAVPVTTTKSPWTIRSEPFKKKDKSRAAFYNTYSEYPWGDIRNYDMAPQQLHRH